MIDYLKSCNLFGIGVYFILCLISNVAQIASNYVLSYWTNKSDDNQQTSKKTFFGLFFLLGFIACKLKKNLITFDFVRYIYWIVNIRKKA